MDSEEVAAIVMGAFTFLMGCMALVGMLAFVVWLCRIAF